MKIAPNALVELSYELFDEKGELVESSSEEGPIRYRHGHEEIIPGLEQALEGAGPGDHVRIELAAEDAYGPYEPEGLLSIPLDELPEGNDYKTGDWVSVVMESDDGSGGEDLGELELRVIETDDEAVILDANHPLAGQAVTFEVEVLSVESPLT